MTDAQLIGAIVTGMSEAVLALDRDDRVRWANPATLALFGYQVDEIGGLAIDSLIAEEDLLALTGIRCAFTDSAGSELNILFRAKDGTLIPTTTGGRLAAVDGATLILVIRDERRMYSLLTQASKDIVTERELLTQAVEHRHAHKLAAVGQLAAGIAHEINTPIQFIADSVTFLRDGFADLFAMLDDYAALAGAVADGTATPAMVNRLRAAAEARDIEFLRAQGGPAFARSLDGLGQVARIVGAMKDFDHAPGGARLAGVVDVNAVITNALIVVRNEYRNVADIHTELAQLPRVLGSKSDLGQVMIHLIVNAAHAVADRGGRGSIRITSERAGADVVVRVSDTGVGMPAEIVDRIFEPFFTTREVGKGSGQGLAISRSIVQRHRGTICVDTELGVGTTFTVQLPAEPAAMP